MAATAEKKTEEEEKASEEVNETLDTLEPQAEQRERVLTYEGEDRIYTQKPLSFFGKMEFFSLVGEAIDNAMSGDNGLTVNGMLNSIAPGADSLSMDNMVDADTFMASAAKIAVYAPDFFKDCYCVWLGVPMGERNWARAALDNISDEEGISIVETFIDQNLEALRDFFNEKLRHLMKRGQDRLDAKSASSKPSKRTRRTTRKQ